MKKLQSRFFQSFFFFLGILILMSFNIEEAKASLPINPQSTNKIVIEHLRLHVSDQERQAWLEAEKGSWEKWLKEKKGFLGRKLFWDPEREEATLMISWATRNEWKSIPQEEIDAVQKHFEELARQGTGRDRGNPFPLLYEGELLPQ